MINVDIGSKIVNIHTFTVGSQTFGLPVYETNEGTQFHVRKNGQSVSVVCFCRKCGNRSELYGALCAKAKAENISCLFVRHAPELGGTLIPVVEADTLNYRERNALKEDGIDEIYI